MPINGEANNLTNLTAKLGIKTPNMPRMLALNTLAPDSIESILAGTEPDELSCSQSNAAAKNRISTAKRS